MEVRTGFVNMPFMPSAKRCPCFRLDAVFFHKGEFIFSLIERMELDLIDGRNDVGIEAEVDDAVWQEIADTDRADPAFFVKLRHSSPGTVIISKRHMDEVKVEVVRAEFLAGTLEGSFVFS